MRSERHLRRKFTFKAHGEQVVLVKRKEERTEHVLMKAFLWALYLPEYPDLTVEVSIGDKYKPDVVSLDAFGEPRFWGEAGSVGREKIESLARRYPRTHFAIAKWATDLSPFIEIVEEALKNNRRRAPFDLLRFPSGSGERFIDDKGQLTLTLDDLDWQRLT